MITYRYNVLFKRKSVRDIHYSREYRRDSAQHRIDALASFQAAMAHDIPEDGGSAWCERINRRGGVETLGRYTAKVTSCYQQGELQGVWGAPKTAEWVDMNR